MVTPVQLGELVVVIVFQDGSCAGSIFDQTKITPTSPEASSNVIDISHTTVIVGVPKLTSAPWPSTDILFSRINVGVPNAEVPANPETLYIEACSYILTGRCAFHVLRWWRETRVTSVSVCSL